MTFCRARLGPPKNSFTLQIARKRDARLPKSFYSCFSLISIAELLSQRNHRIAAPRFIPGRPRYSGFPRGRWSIFRFISRAGGKSAVQDIGTSPAGSRSPTRYRQRLITQPTASVLLAIIAVTRSPIGTRLTVCHRPGKKQAHRL